MDFSEKMKRTRLDYYEEDVEEIHVILDDFLETSQSKCVLLIDKEGHMVTKKGFTKSFDATALSALVAGSFSATREVARILGEEQFDSMVHEGSNENICVRLAGDRALLVIVFDDRTTLGMVRVTGEQLATKITKTLLEAEERNKDRTPPSLGEGYESSAQDILDDFFKES